ncbi:protein NUCLEAR FUSION DEFECTIVE 6, chloroplastic/mitochondrial-like isoform X1 [Senna tora]|uniref:Protein NUCLEAR FUSION DEFECTIVE 6, chloroplastic/mitochondrial-like isoform X1 n=1 Tax=Senna tora TaxID=362788 RepID=A0A834STM7_9FABA|nr:protein NUCLEAR FUSION DEFECTIVE 6, chloroplastic/mitochondrial-like isoform X1 [Senna tora]
MASACSRIARRTSLASSIKSAIKSNVRNPSFCRSSNSSTTPTNATSTPLLRSFLTRTAPELGCLQSMLPLHSAVAVARMTSCLSTTSRSCRALSQGTLCCTSPGL